MFRESRRWLYLACSAFLVVAIGAGLAVPVASAQGVPGQLPGIVVIGFGTASAPAESAKVQLIVGPEMYGGPPTTMLTETDFAPITDAIVSAGVDKAAIEIYIPATNSMFSGPGGPGNGLLEFTISDPTDASMRSLADTIYQAAATARLSVQHLGVRYAATDCAALQQAATDAAVADARSRGERMAKSLHAQLGTLTQAMDSIYGVGTPDSCTPPGLGGYGPYGPNISNPYDPSAAVEATATAQITLTFEMETAAGATPVSS